jgi:hypothetical protein
MSIPHNRPSAWTNLARLGLDRRDRRDARRAPQPAIDGLTCDNGLIIIIIGSSETNGSLLHLTQLPLVCW